jgi:hypothetical protein
VTVQQDRGVSGRSQDIPVYADDLVPGADPGPIGAGTLHHVANDEPPRGIDLENHAVVGPRAVHVGDRQTGQ